MKGDRIGVGRTAEIFEWGEGQVVKIYFDWCPDKWIEFEAKVSKIVEEANLPVPKCGGIADADGKKGLILERIEGMSMMQCIENEFTGPDNFDVLDKYGKMLGELHAELHSKSITGLPNVYDHVESGISRTDKLSDTQKEKLIKVLDSLPEGNAVCHYDFHPGNIIMSPNGPILIDWITGCIGNPHGDIARTIILMSYGNHPPDIPREAFQQIREYLIKVYLDSYKCKLDFSQDEVERWRIPVSAARLNENIEEVEQDLLGYISQAGY